MRRALAITVILAVTALVIGMVGCGVAPEEYAAVADQLIQSREKIASLERDKQELEAENAGCDTALQEAQSKIAELNGQLGLLEDSYRLEGATPTETAGKIVRYYHETHVYSITDMFICSDMSSEVWNMLKAQGIDSLIVIGNTEQPIDDILESNHAWVLAEVATEQYLALETTAGTVVYATDNPLYYRGWFFSSPTDLKLHNSLVREYNVRVKIHNDIVAEDNDVVAEYNRSTSQPEAEKLMAVHEKLVEIIEAQEVELGEISAEMKGLAAGLNLSD